MKSSLLLTLFLSIGTIVSTQAQDSLSTRITYDLTTEASVGTGDFTAYQLSWQRGLTRPTCAEQLILNIR